LSAGSRRSTDRVAVPGYGAGRPGTVAAEKQKGKPMRIETTDGRYVKVAADSWRNTTGVDLVRQCVVDAYLQANRRVGIAVLGNRR
jgi:hypothetical protein